MATRLEREVAVAEVREYGWRAVVDSMRPVTQALWKQLSIPERRRFLRHAITLWNVHRHRMAPQAFAQVQQLRREGRLAIVAGTVGDARPSDNGSVLTLRRRGSDRLEPIDTPLILNCTGPSNDIAHSGHALLENLCAHGLITPSPLRAGLALDALGRPQGQAPNLIYPIGSLLFGELLESTAVPELRVQARETARNVLARVSLPAPID
jgi:uncharacterized NAD(P)/FAD-binding protein YdhS